MINFAILHLTTKIVSDEYKKELRKLRSPNLTRMPLERDQPADFDRDVEEQNQKV